MGAKVTLCDKKPNLEAFGEYGETLKQLGIGLSLGENYMDGFEGQDIIMRTPGFEFYTPALQKAHEHLSLIHIWCAAAQTQSPPR